MSARAAMVFLAALVLLWVALPRLRPATDDAGAVQAIETRLAQATARGDAKAVGRIIAGDFFSVDANGNRETRASILDRLRANPWHVQLFQQEDLEIHLFGETAIATGIDRVQARDAGGRDYNGAYRFLHVFQKRNGRWRLIAGQGVRLAAPSR
jgi:ketosteroid isomerase-like protein